MKKIFILFTIAVSMLITVSVLPMYAGTEPYTNVIKARALAINDSLKLKDGKYGTGDWSNIDSIFSCEDYIYFAFDPYLSDSLGLPFTASLDLDIYTTDAYGTETGPYSITLNIDYDTSANAEYQSKSLYHFRGAHKIRTYIQNFTFTGVGYTTIPWVF